MTALVASKKIAISGSGDCWKVAEPSDFPPSVKERQVFLEIVGNDQDGYHLNMSPDGCFTADTWHPTVVDALDTANRVFDVPESAWRRRKQ